jgi:hypothetical protein
VDRRDDETTQAFEAMSSNAWVVSHLFAMVGFLLVSLALLGLRELVGIRAVAVTWVGAGLTLPYYGAEDFGLHGAATQGDKYSGLAFAAGFVLFLPQFFTPAPVRIAHGVLMLIGLVWLAMAVPADAPRTTVPRLSSQRAA